MPPILSTKDGKICASCVDKCIKFTVFLLLPYYNNVKVVLKNFIGKTHNITKKYLPLQANSSCEEKKKIVIY